MKKQKTKNKGDFYGEVIFNIAAYNCSRNYVVGRCNSKRAELSMLTLVEYMHNVGQKNKNEVAKRIEDNKG